MPKTMQLHRHVTALVMNIDQIIFGLCSNPCSIKAKAPIAIIRNVGKAMPSVLRVRMVSMACGRYPSISPVLATYPQMVYKVLCSIFFCFITNGQAKWFCLFKILLFAKRRCHVVTEEIEFNGISLRFARPSCQ